MEKTSINLGRCHSKYLIIEMFSFAAKEDAKEEAEEVLWPSSRRHRGFLRRNFDWYPRNLDFILTHISLMK
jgi:hypothetical protein